MSVESYGDEDLGALRDSIGRSAFFKLKDGDNKIRIVKWKNAEGKKRTCCKRVEHFIPGSSNVVCTGKGCAVCDKAARLMADNDAKNQETGKRMRAQDRVYFNVVDRENEAGGVQMVAFPPGLSKNLLDLLNDPDYNTNAEGEVVMGLMTDPELGRDFKIKRFIEDGFTRYTPTPAPNPSKLSVEIAETATDIEAYLTKGAAPKAKEAGTESAPAEEAKPSCHQDGETFDSDSEICKECDFNEGCDTKGL